jgi:hypothetical protein
MKKRTDVSVLGAVALSMSLYPLETETLKKLEEASVPVGRWGVNLIFGYFQLCNVNTLY